jgi:tryptophan halogenase
MTSEHHPIRHIVIVGGGTAGWMCAAAAARMLDDGQRRITLVESDAIGIVGVGEATIPPILAFNAMLGIDEGDFVAATHATFKLGIAFHGWGRPSDRYVHPFGALGHDFDGVAFHQLWLRHRAADGVGPIEDYSISAAAAHRARFDRPRGDPRSPLSGLSYAYHFDAAAYAGFLRAFAEQRGVERVEGRIGSVEQDVDGDVAAVLLDDGRRVTGDLFIDCSGFRSLLIGETMDVPYRDWSHWLPCDRAIAVPCERRDPLAPLTRATARPAGWQWRIPLQHRTGNGHVYSSAFMDDEAAEALLLANLDAPPSDTPRRLSFVTGRRERMWQGNVVALGLSAGFVEPLESTSIHLIQSGISKLIALFPDNPIAAVERDEYNRLMTAQFDAVRDFVILHYKANQRHGEPFWDRVRDMAIPDSLAGKIALFAEKGRLFRYDDDLFAVPSWVAVLLGQHIVPRAIDPVTASLDDGRIVAAMIAMRRGIAGLAEIMPDHAGFVANLVGAANARTGR